MSPNLFKVLYFQIPHPGTEVGDLPSLGYSHSPYLFSIPATPCPGLLLSPTHRVPHLQGWQGGDGGCSWVGWGGSTLPAAGCYDAAPSSSPRKPPGIQKGPSHHSAVHRVWLGQSPQRRGGRPPPPPLVPALPTPPSLNQGSPFPTQSMAWPLSPCQTGKLHGPNATALAP